MKDGNFQKLDMDFNNHACAIVPKMEGWNVLNVNYWAYKELNVPIPPQKRIYKTIGHTICQMGLSDKGLEFLFFDRPGTKGDFSVYSCSELKEKL